MNLLINILITPIIYVTSFLWHEFCHIKSQGLLATGRINVNKYGMTCGCNDTWNNRLFFLGGGILSSIIMFIFVFATKGWIQWCFLTMGYVQLFYGLFEGYKPYNIKYRFVIYFIIITVMIIIWGLLHI